MKKAALHNLGCKVNAYETEAMQQQLEQAGFEIVPFSQKADVYVINTCSVTNMADRKSRQMLHRAKKMNPESIVVAAGCYVQTAAEEAKKDAAVDILIGNNKKHELLERILEFEQKKREAKGEHVIDLSGKTCYEELTLNKTAEHTRAFLKVQDGCNQFCSYCIIPYARGRVRSRPAEDVISEVRRLAENGYQEVVLTGIHLSSYGADTGDNLLNLIQMVHAVEGIRRIRLGSLEPNIVTEEFAEALSRLPKLCPHFHLSLQSGCDATLKRMNRRYTCEDFKKGCGILRSYFDHPAITTDVIVGFPGETEEEFEAARRFIKETAFFEMHIFKYSLRKGTKAAQMKDQVPEEIKQKRSAALCEDAESMAQEFVSWYQQKTVEVLLEECTVIKGEKYMTGHTPEYVKAAVRTSENMENKRLRGRVKCCLEDHVLLLDEESAENID